MSAAVSLGSMKRSMPFIEEAVMFGKKRKDTVRKSYDSARQEPVIISSICNGERVAGFRDIHSKRWKR